jgi:hypothetical protein
MKPSGHHISSSTKLKQLCLEKCALEVAEMIFAIKSTFSEHVVSIGFLTLISAFAVLTINLFIKKIKTMSAKCEVKWNISRLQKIEDRGDCKDENNERNLPGRRRRIQCPSGCGRLPDLL